MLIFDIIFCSSFT